MASLCGHAHCYGQPARRQVDGFSTSSSMQHRSCFLLHRPIALPLLRTSTSSISGTSSYLLLRPCPPHLSRAMRRSQPGMVSVIKAAFIFEWIQNIIKFLTKTPIKLFAQKLEDDLDRAAKMVKTGAAIIVEVAKEADEFAEKIERAAERAEEIAEKVAKDTETIEERVGEILDVIEGEKKVVITSFKVVDNEDEVGVKSTTTIAQDANKSIVTIETSTVNDSNLDKTKSL